MSQSTPWHQRVDLFTLLDEWQASENQGAAPYLYGIYHPAIQRLLSDQSPGIASLLRDRVEYLLHTPFKPRFHYTHLS